MNVTPCIMAWSGGKDSAIALYRLLSDERYEVKGLFTTIHGKHRRISMHGVREELLELQADLIGIPLHKMYVEEGTGEEYEERMEALMSSFCEEGIEHVVFGDIFLEDLRAYREKQLEKANMKGVFPLWKEDTLALLEESYRIGIRTIPCTCREGSIDPSLLGEVLTPSKWKNFPKNVDPCGEYGEFHTFVTEAPYFGSSIPVVTGERVQRHLEDPEGKGRITFHYLDLLPEGQGSADRP